MLHLEDNRRSDDEENGSFGSAMDENKHVLIKKTEDIYTAPESASKEEQVEEEL